MRIESNEWLRNRTPHICMDAGTENCASSNRPTQASGLVGLAGNKPVTGCWWLMIRRWTIRWYWSSRTPELLRLRMFFSLAHIRTMLRASLLANDENSLQFNWNLILETSCAFLQRKHHCSTNRRRKCANHTAHTFQENSATFSRGLIFFSY